MPGCTAFFGVIDWDYGGGRKMKINVMTDVLEANDRIAAVNKDCSTAAGTW
jgi:hypothetical protein